MTCAASIFRVQQDKGHFPEKTTVCQGIFKFVQKKSSGEGLVNWKQRLLKTVDCYIATMSRWFVLCLSKFYHVLLQYVILIFKSYFAHCSNIWIYSYKGDYIWKIKPSACPCLNLICKACRVNKWVPSWIFCAYVHNILCAWWSQPFLIYFLHAYLTHTSILQHN